MRELRRRRGLSEMPAGVPADAQIRAQAALAESGRTFRNILIAGGLLAVGYIFFLRR